MGNATGLAALLEAVFGRTNGKNTPLYEYGMPAWKYFDNFKIRMILGDVAFNLPPGGIGEEHLRLAIRRLGSFAVVRTFSAAKRWDGTLPEIGWNLSVAQSNVMNSRPPFGQGLEQWLLHLNRYDV